MKKLYKVYFDTNILLDFALKRKKFNTVAAQFIILFQNIETEH